MKRRVFVCAGMATLVTSCMEAPPTIPVERDALTYFPDLDRPAILVDTARRRLYFWGASGETYREFPIGVARSDDLLRLGRTTVVRKREGPDWRPTPSMLRINPDLPRYVPPGPDNPLGAYALYLGWQYYAIHGTNDPYTIGRRTTSGCFRLFDGHIAWLYANAPLGTRVLVI